MGKFIIKKTPSGAFNFSLYAVNKEKIAVYGDYDADGVTSTAVLYLFFEKMGADITYYIPDRNTEGYGLNKEAIKELSERIVAETEVTVNACRGAYINIICTHLKIVEYTINLEIFVSIGFCYVTFSSLF